LQQKKWPVLDITGFLFRMCTQVNAEVNSKHRKMRAKQQHVCKEMMNQYIINTNRKWILSFDIEWTIGVKYRKKPFNLNKK
jgi:hypothetical protein